jgi:hypothetical protein
VKEEAYVNAHFDVSEKWTKAEIDTCDSTLSAVRSTEGKTKRIRDSPEKRQR